MVRSSSKAPASPASPALWPRDRRGRRALLALFLVALGVRLLALWDAADHPGFTVPIVDASFYDLAARELAGVPQEGAASGAREVISEARLFWQPFLYPRLLALIYGLGGGILTVKLLQALVGALTAAGTFLLGGRRLGFGPGLAAGLAVAFYGPLILFEGELLAAGWAAFAAVALLLLLEWAGERGGRETAGEPEPEEPATAWPSALAMALVAAAGAAAVLLRPTFLPFVAAAGGWLTARLAARHGRHGRRRAAVAAVAGLLVFAALTLPVARAAEEATGRFSFLPGSGALNLYIGNSENPCRTLTIRPGEAWGDLLSLPEAAGMGSPAERPRYYRGRVLEWAREHPVRLLAHQGAKALRFGSSRELPRNLDVYVQRRWSTVLSVLVWKVGPFGFPFGLLLPLAVVGVVGAWRRLGTPLLLFLTLYPLAVIAVFVSARYRVPVVPALAVAAAAGGAVLVEAWWAGRRRRLAGLGALLLAAALLATVPGPFCEELEPMAADFWRNLGSAQSQRGNETGAADSYRRALDEYRALPGDVPRDAWEVHLNLGRLEGKAGDAEAALEHYRRAVELAPGEGEPHYNLGLLLLGRGDAAGAAEQLGRAARLEPGLPRVAVYLGRALLAAGRPGEALPVARGAVQAAPRDPRARFLLGGLLLQAGRAEEAVAELERALELGPAGPGDRAEIHNELGTALMALGRAPAAVAQYRAALEARPDYRAALANLGAVLAMGGQLEEARRLFARGVELAPEDPTARLNLARTLEALGRSEEAREQLERARKLEAFRSPSR